MVAPEVNKITVFNNGTPKALNVSYKNGGQIPPIAGLGFKLT